MQQQPEQHITLDPDGPVALLRYAQRMHRSAQTDSARRLFALYAAQAKRRLHAARTQRNH